MLRDNTGDSSAILSALDQTAVPADTEPAAASPPFHSVLHSDPSAAGRTAVHEAPAFFHDLLLDHIVKAVLGSASQDFDLAPYFYAPLTGSATDRDAIRYRQEIMRDMDSAATMDVVKSFLAAMHAMRERCTLAQKLYYQYEKRWWHLEAIDTYCQAVVHLTEALHRIALKSRGMLALRGYLADHIQTAPFQTLLTGAARLKADLAAIRYCLLIYGNSVTVQPYEGEADYSAAVEATFDKFRRRAVKDYRVKFPRLGGVGHVEAQIQDRVALLNPDTFGALNAFCAEHADFLDERIARFDREIQFYVAYLTYLDTFRRAGLPFCYPTVSRASKDIHCVDGFDLALAGKLVNEVKPVVCNDFRLHAPERICLISGPNQGGKTTFARMFGQMHYLACLGCPVPGKEARLFHFDQLFTHFEREEDITNLRGKLQDDLVRIHRILDAATADSLVILNEIFASTTLKDAVFLATRILTRLSAMDVLGVCVTFLTELSTLDEKMASFVSMVDPADPAIRTYKIERRRADGLAYAMALAEKYHVTYGELKQRIQP